ncbi:MAG: transcriptional repressor [Tissierellia bacterium]|nr:transcriptional repressor [Tissierellia bacterium]
MNKRYSAQKMMIEEALMRLDHPTASEIHDYIKKSYPNISLGTVYRNLGLMAESGDVLRITFGDAPDRFDINTHDHFHVMCKKCGQVFDAESDRLKELLAQIDQSLEETTGVHIENRSMYYQGICSSCREQS